MSNLQFVSYQTIIDVTFWYELQRKKLDEFRLNDEVVQLTGYYSLTKGNTHPKFYIPADAFKTPQIPVGSVRVQGYLKVFNTFEEFAACDKQKVLFPHSKQIEDGEIMNCFFIIVYADLKNFDFSYWVCHPSINFKPTVYEQASLEDIFDVEYAKTELSQYIQQEDFSGLFSVQNGQISHFDKNSDIVGFFDSTDNPAVLGSGIRNLISFQSRHNKDCITVVSIKDQVSTNPDFFKLFNTKVFKITPPQTDKIQFVGWERNQEGVLGAKHINLKEMMDPQSIAQSSVDLNIKLMKWRMCPDLLFEEIQSLKCLLLGAGTLGCNIARNLLAWGVRNITLVDNSNISHSNPVRQSLFTFQDAQENLPKAETAAQRLREIFPGVNSQGIKMMIPMPGHPYDNLGTTISHLNELIQNHDAVFLLMDTRESRWLPTLLAQANGKICISSALGFESFMIIRHGQGCYFCSDVTAPGNSTIDRTLDQQCTVTRPGLAYLASALTVEMLISDMHQVQGIERLGCPPRMIRGSLGNYEFLNIEVAQSSYCVACSPSVIHRYQTEEDFIQKCIESPDYLMEVVGLSEMDINADDIIEISD